MANRFTPPWWLPNRHLQTIWPTVMRRTQQLAIQSERLELPDGDFLDLAWVGPQTGPIVIVLHGIAGSLDSPYASGILHALQQSNWRGLFIHFRGSSGIPNRLARFYHSGETGDLDYVVKFIKQREPQTTVAAIGYSLGGNVLLKWLTECKDKNLLTTAVAISVPFELKTASEQINTGFSRLYQWYLLRNLRSMVKQKFANQKTPIDITNIDELQSLWEFDNKITAPLHGFKDAADYYEKSSTRHLLKNIAVPTLILQSSDDPFLTPDANPQPHELSDKITFELYNAGGHLGFVTGKYPWQPVYWLEQRIIEYLKEHDFK